MTSKKLGIALLSLVVLAIFAVAPAAAASAANPLGTIVSPGDTVYIGESGLDISNAVGEARIIKWYKSGAIPGGETAERSYEIPGPEVSNFYVQEAVFGDCIGDWYVGDSTDIAFRVQRPSLAIGLYRDDYTTSVDGKKVIADYKVALRIDSTFAKLFDRARTDNNTNWDVFAINLSGEIPNFTFLNDPGSNQTALDEYLATVVGAGGTSYMEGEITEATNATTSTAFDPVNSPGVNVYAISPENAKLTKLILVGDNGQYAGSSNLEKQHPSASTYWLNGVQTPVWSAGRLVDENNVLGTKIVPGEYKFYADININGMKDNLGSKTGQTVSSTVTVTIDKETVTITADKATVIRNNGFSVTIEGTPKGSYAVWFTGVNGYTSGEVPAFIRSQKDVTPMGWLNATNASYKSSKFTIAEDLPDDLEARASSGNDITGDFAVVAKLDAAGKITIGLITNENTKDTSYTIRAEKIKSFYNSTEGSSGYELDFQLYDTVKVKVEKGAVTVSASGDGSYYLGEEVTLSGTNTDSDDVYLFITGPNLPESGGMLENPKQVPENPHAFPDTDKFTRVNVKTDDTWEFKWDTSGSILDAGTYTIYATSDFALKSGGNKTLTSVEYDTVSVVIKKPFVTATTSASTVAKGDKLYIRGTAEGNPTAGVAIWILGKNYWNGENKDEFWRSTKVVETVNDDGSFEHEIDSGITRSMASGQYFVVVQHPMYNGQFDVNTKPNKDGDAYPNRIEDSNSIQVITNPKGVNKENVNGVAFIIAGDNKLQGSDAAEALITAINSANIDDTYTKLTFLVEEPWIRVNSVGDHYIGDQFKITGTTNLAVGDDLIVEVTSSSFQPTQKTQSGEFSGVSSTVKVTEGSSYNEWGMDVDASTFKADEYIVNVEAIEADVTTTTTFNILSGSATVAPTSAPTTAPTTKPTTAPTTAPTPAATASPGFGALVALIGLGAVAALIIRKD